MGFFFFFFFFPPNLATLCQHLMQKGIPTAQLRFLTYVQIAQMHAFCHLRVHKLLLW